MEAWLDAHPVDIFINCAAYTAVDKAESEKEKAFRVNAEARDGSPPGLQKTKPASSIFPQTMYSTEPHLVPLTEEARTNPVNRYGATKLEGEKLVFKITRPIMVIRTSWLYSAYGNNFVKTMIRLMKERESHPGGRRSERLPYLCRGPGGSHLADAGNGTFHTRAFIITAMKEKRPGLDLPEEIKN